MLGLEPGMAHVGLGLLSVRTVLGLCSVAKKGLPREVVAAVGAGRGQGLAAPWNPWGPWDPHSINS